MSDPRVAKLRSDLTSRLPLIGDWRRRRAIRALVEDGSAAAFQILADAILRHPDADSVDRCLEAMAAEAKAGCEKARAALLSLVIDHDHAAAASIVEEAAYLPRSEAQRAVFFFLTGQWEQYESLDFDHRLLRAAYEHGDPRLKRRITAEARAAGRLEWVEIAAGGRTGRRLRLMSDAEWRAALDVLSDHHRWEEMWRLAQDAPPRWAAALLRCLHTARWSPSPADQADLEHLSELAQRWPDSDFRFALQEQAVLRGHQDDVRCLAYSPDGRYLASGSGDQTVRLWNLRTQRQLRVLSGHRDAVNCLAMTARGSVLASGGREGVVWLWRLSSGEPIAKLKAHRQLVAALAVTPDGRILASAGADGLVQLWNVPEASARATLDRHDRPVLALAMSPDGELLASAGADGTVCLWDVQSGHLRKRLHGHRNDEFDAVLSLAFAPNGRLLASGGTDKTICLWSLPGGDLRETLDEHLGPVDCLTFSRDGATLASGSSDKTLRFWSIPEGVPLRVEEAHSGGLTRLLLSPDGCLLASASGDGLGHDHVIRLWDMDERRAVGALYGHTRYITSLAINPTGDCLASGGGDGTVRLWTAELARLAALPVREATLRDLERAESTLRSTGLAPPQRHAWELIAALLRRSRRHDIQVAEPSARVIPVGAFDIEIEG